MNNASRVIVRLMRENEQLRLEIGQYRIVHFGRAAEPQSPFPLLTGSEILAVLHPGDRGAR
jgi:hypothetical protein